jgi:hypothetical protein
VSWRGAILALCALFGGCSDVSRDPITFDCDVEAPGEEERSIRGTMHFEEGYLFLKNAAGGADNVCSRMGTLDCSVNATLRGVSLRQTVELPKCHWRQLARISLDVARDTGKFVLVEEGCDPTEDVTFTGTCRFR